MSYFLWSTKELWIRKKGSLHPTLGCIPPGAVSPQLHCVCYVDNSGGIDLIGHIK